MNKRQRKVFTLLKTKTKAIGFNRKELESLALKIDKNLTLEEEDLDEEEDAAIEQAIDAAIPFLEVSQSMAQRSIQSSIQRFRERHGINEDDDDDEEGDEPRNRQRTKGKSKETSEESELIQLIKGQNEAIKSLKDQLEEIRGGRVHETRRTQLEKLVKDTGSFGKSVLKQFDRMKFDNEDSFEEYLDEVQKDLDELNQERANEGLGKLGTVPGTGGKANQESKPEELSDDEVIALAGGSKAN